MRHRLGQSKEVEDDLPVAKKQENIGKRPRPPRSLSSFLSSSPSGEVFRPDSDARPSRFFCDPARAFSAPPGIARAEADVKLKIAGLVSSEDQIFPPSSENGISSSSPVSSTAAPARTSTISTPSSSSSSSSLSPSLNRDQATSEFEQNSLDNALFYNPLTGRMCRASSPICHGLEEIGIKLDRKSMKLVMAEPNKFDDFVRKVRVNTASLPTWWTQRISRSLQAALRMTEGPTSQLPSSVAADSISLSYRLYDQRNDAGSVYATGTTFSEVAAAESRDCGGVPSSKDHDPQQSREVSTLTDEQRRVLQLVLSGHNLYLGGGAGTGKTATLLTIREFLQRRIGLSVAMTATTGVAAQQIHGTTFHRCFGVRISGDFHFIEAMRRFDVVIIDEISMFPKTLFEKFDLSMRRARGKPHLPFGGCQVILCGDFMQLSAISDEPIVASPTFRNHFIMAKLNTVIRQTALSEFSIQLQLLRRGIVTDSLKNSFVAMPPGQIVQDAINLLPTNEQVHAANEAELQKIPEEAITFVPHVTPLFLVGKWTKTAIIRIGNIAGFDFVDSLAKITVHFSSSVFTSQTLFCHNISFYPVFSDAYALRVRISPWMSPEEVIDISSKIENIAAFISKLPCAQASEMSVADIVTNGDGLHTDRDEQRIESMCNASPFHQHLKLKHGAKIMLRANISSYLVNGSVGTVIGFVESTKYNISNSLMSAGCGISQAAALEQYNHFCKYELDIAVPLLPVCKFGDRVETIPPHGFIVGGQIDSHFYASTIVTLPLTLAYAFTVHKVQGLTLHGRVHLELSRMWECNHLLYVAMSRVKNPNQLSLSSFDERLVKVAEECLVFDDSLPSIDRAKILPTFISAQWRRAKSIDDISQQADLTPAEQEALQGCTRSRRYYGYRHPQLIQRVLMAQEELQGLFPGSVNSALDDCFASCGLSSAFVDDEEEAAHVPWNPAV